MSERLYSYLRWVLPAMALVAIGSAVWWMLQPPGLPAGFASSNGRVEAVEINIATKIPGRVKAILVNEGDVVQPGEVLVRMDTATLDAQLREAKAALVQARVAVDTAKNFQIQRQAEQKATAAVIAQRAADLTLATKRLKRALALKESGAISDQAIDDSRAAFDSTTAALRASKAQLAAADAAVSFATSSVASAQSGVEAAMATLERIQADIDDST